MPNSNKEYYCWKKNLLNYCLKQQNEQWEIKNKVVCIIISYLLGIQNSELRPFLISLVAAIGKAAVKSGAAVLGTSAGKKCW